MNDKSKKTKIFTLIWKILITIGVLSFLAMLFTAAEGLKLILFITSMCVGIIAIIISKIFSEYIDLSKKTVSEKYQVKKYEYNDIIKLLSKNTDFEKSELNISDNTLGTVFNKITSKSNILHGKTMLTILVLNMDEYSQSELKKSLDKLNEKTMDWLDEYEENYCINLPVILCIKNTTKEFMNYIDSDIIQFGNLIKVPIGITADTKTMYIASQKSIECKGRYKKLKENVLEILSEIIK